MARCIRCGEDAELAGRRICDSCMDKWLNKRNAAFDQAEAELGTLSKDNLKAIQKRIKQLEK